MNRRDLLSFGGVGIVSTLFPIEVKAKADRAETSLPYLVQTYRYSGPGTVNTHWIEAPDGVVVVDVQRDLPHAREALGWATSSGKPVVALLVTHGHPDHYAGLGVFKTAFPKAMIVSSETTMRTIRDDTYGYNKYMKKAVGNDFPNTIPLPDHILRSNETLTVAGVPIETGELGQAEANSATAYYLPKTGDLFLGDIILYRMHVLLTEKHSTDWLRLLSMLPKRYPDTRMSHPGHGLSAPLALQIADMRDYITTYRNLVIAARDPNGTVSDAKKNEIVAAIKAKYPHRERPAGIPDMLELNVDALAAELNAERKSQP